MDWLKRWLDWGRRCRQAQQLNDRDVIWHAQGHGREDLLHPCQVEARRRGLWL